MTIPRPSLEERLHLLKVEELGVEEINRITGVVAVLDHADELPPGATLRALVPLWIRERAKGSGANAKALERIEAILFSATGLAHDRREAGARSAKRIHKPQR